MKKHILEEKIEKALSDYSMTEIFDGCIIGFSGGSDSSALLHYFAGKTKNITAVHINHMIRGSEANRDEEFCKEFCKELGVKFVSYKIDIPSIAKEKKQGIEQTAREERYRVFDNEMQKDSSLKAILTAHNADDNVETVIFNLVRGTGSRGLAGIDAVNGNIYRPLIYCEKLEIEDYCLKNGIKYVTDSTNLDTDYTRNYIRHEIIPKLKKINASLDISVIKMGKIVRQDDRYINSVAEKIISDNKISDKANTSLLASLDESVAKRILRKMADDNLGYVSLESCIDLIKKAECGQIINLENGISFKKEHDYVHFLKTEALKSKKYDISLKDGINLIEEIDVALVLNSDIYPTGYTKCCEILLNKTFEGKTIHARSRLDGDIIKHGGMTKKLKKIFCEKHIPSHKRDFYPVLYDEDGIISVMGLVERDGIKDKNSTVKITMLKKDI